MIENYPCDNKKELKQREEYYIKMLNANLNSKVRDTGLEYNKNKIKEYNKQYKKLNKDRISQYNKEYYKKKVQKNKKKKTGIKPKQFDSNTIDTCIKLYKDGETKVDISKKLNISAYYVSRIINSN